MDCADALLDFKLRRTFLTTFRTYSTAERIYELLLERYNLKVPEDLSPAELDDWRTRRLLPTQRRVLLIFKTWLVDHAFHLESHQWSAYYLIESLIGLVYRIAGTA